MSDSTNTNTNNKEDLNQKLGELGNIVHSKLKENGKPTEGADNVIKGIQNFVNESYAKVEKSDDKEQTKKDIAQSILGKVEQYAGKGEVNKEEPKKD